jgi:hypothetical protein
MARPAPEGNFYRTVLVTAPVTGGSFGVNDERRNNYIAQMTHTGGARRKHIQLHDVEE